MKQQSAIAVAQSRPLRGDIEGNLVEHVRLAELAARRGSSVVVFPELSLTGYELELAAELALTENDARLGPLLDTAARRALTIVAGAPLRREQKLHIASFIVQPDRSVLLYTKQRLGAFDEAARCDGDLPPPEPSVFQPGALDPLLPLGDGVAALAICADTGRASHPRKAAERGANVYLASMFVIPSEIERDCEKLGSYAKELSLVVASANFGSSTGGLAAAGRSSIWSDDGALVGQLPPRGAGVLVAERDARGWHAQSAMLDD